MTLEIKLSQEDEVTLLNAAQLCWRLGEVRGCKLASVASIAAKKLYDVLDEAKAKEVEGAPF